MDAKQPVAAIDATTLQKVEAYIEQEEGAQHRFAGGWGTFLFIVAVGMSVFHLWAAYGNINPYQLRYAHVGFVLFLAFTLFPWRRSARNRFSWIDLVLALISVGTMLYAFWGGDDFLDRSTLPNQLDNILGVVFVFLVLEAARRTTGWIMPFVVILFIVYAMVGRWLPAPWTHVGYDIGRLVGQYVHDARRHLRHGGGRCVVSHHPVHHLRCDPAVLGRGQVLPRFIVRGAWR